MNRLNKVYGGSANTSVEGKNKMQDTFYNPAGEESTKHSAPRESGLAAY